MSGCYALQNGRYKTHLRPPKDANCSLTKKVTLCGNHYDIAITPSTRSNGRFQVKYLVYGC